ncbi:MAG: MutT/nudix family protein [uncultured bacterium]|nr:MAG: MutT/nudix family protein [uncultured bacterium]
MNEMKPGKDYIGVGGGVLIFNDSNEVLLMKRGTKAKNEAGWWSKPGGSVEYGEKASEMAKREIKEELNIDIEITGLLPHTDHIIENEGQHWLAINFIGKVVGGELKNMEPHKCEEVRWFKLNEIPEMIVQNTAEGIENYRNGKYIKL